MVVNKELAQIMGLKLHITHPLIVGVGWRLVMGIILIVMCIIDLVLVLTIRMLYKSLILILVPLGYLLVFQIPPPQPV